MNRLNALAIACLLVTPVGLSACGDRAKMEPCTLLEIEDAEFEVDMGDVDAERGEVEMVCGDDIVDVRWSEFRQKLGIDPERYKNNLPQFRQQVNCLKDERSQNELFCSGGSANDFVTLTFSEDD